MFDSITEIANNLKNLSTGTALSSMVAHPGILWSKFMAPFTMGLPMIQREDGFSSKVIFALTHCLKMIWIHTSPVPARRSSKAVWVQVMAHMVDVFAEWNWTPEYLIYNPMRRNHLKDSISKKRGVAVPLFIDVERPVDAAFSAIGECIQKVSCYFFHSIIVPFPHSEIRVF